MPKNHIPIIRFVITYREGAQSEGVERVPSAVLELFYKAVEHFT
jgi:hypothetical protein